MNSTVLALLLLAGMNGLPDRSGLPTRDPARQERFAQSVLRQPTDQATRLAAKGRLPQDRLRLRMDERLVLAQAQQ